MRATRRLLLACILAPLCAPLVVALQMMVMVAASGDGFRDLPIGVMLVFFIGAPISYAGTLLVGLPIYWWLARQNRATAWNLVYVGASAGLILVLALMVFLENWRAPRDLLKVTLLWGPLPGALVAWVFGAVSGFSPRTVSTTFRR